MRIPQILVDLLSIFGKSTTASGNQRKRTQEKVLTFIVNDPELLKKIARYYEMEGHSSSSPEKAVLIGMSLADLIAEYKGVAIEIISQDGSRVDVEIPVSGADNKTKSKQGSRRKLQLIVDNERKK